MALKEDKVQVTVMVDGKQAINQLGKLEMEATELKQEMKSLKKGTDEYKAAADKLKGLDVAIKKQREEMGLTGMTMKQLRNYQRELNRELDSGVTRGTARYNELKNKVQEVNKVIDQQRQEVRGLGGIWQSISKEVKQFGILAASYLGFEFITGQIGNIIRGNAKMSDSLADIRKTTGMTTEEVKGLVSELGKINTRTANAALREIAIVGGQIGVAKEEMLGFVESVDMAVVALGDEFTGGAEQVAREIGSLQRLFKETKDMNPGEAISKIGSALNELGAAGSATSPEVAEFAKRLGPLGNLAPQISETLGLGAAFQELGLTAEISSGGLSNILLVAAKGADKFAELIGKSREEVAKWINEDPNKFVLELAESLQGLSNEQVAQVLQELGINSQEATKVMSLLADKTDFVRQKQELAAEAMEENISLQEENNIKQQTFGALIDRISKKINSMVNNQGFVSFLTSAAENTYSLLIGLQKFVLYLKEIPSFLDKSKYAIAGLTAAMILMNWEHVKAYAWLIKEEVALKRKIVTDKLATLATNGQTIAQRALNMVMKANPIMLVISAVALLAGALMTLYTNSQTVRAAVDGIWEALKTLVVNIKDNVLDLFDGLGDLLTGVFTLDTEKIKSGLTKAIKSALSLTPVGIAITSGQKMADAFSKGYNDRLNLENGVGKATSDQAKNTFLGNDMLQGTGPTDKRLEYAAQVAEKNKQKQEDDNKSKADAFLQAQEAEKERKKRAKAARDAAEKARKERERLEAEEARRQLEMLRALEDAELALLADGFEKKRRQLVLSYQRDREERIANRTMTAEIEKALEEKLFQDIEKLKKEQEAKKLADAQKKIDKEQAVATEGVETDFLAMDLEAKLQNDALAELDAAAWKQQRLWEIEREGLEKRLELLKGNDEQTVFQRQQLQARLDQLALTSQAVAFAQEQARAKAELALQQQKYDAASQIVGSYGNAILDMMNVIGSSSAEMVAFQKAVAFAQILIDTAAAISSVTAKNAATSITPIDYAVKVAAAVGTVIANIGKAKALLGSAQPPAAPSFFFGGGTGSSGMGFGDKYGEFAGMVHKNEYVIPSLVRADPQVANYEALIESKRTGLRANRIQEEKAGKGNSGSSAKMEQLMLAMVEEQRANREELRSFRGRLKADISLHEFRDAEELEQQLHDETTF